MQICTYIVYDNNLLIFFYICLKFYFIKIIYIFFMYLFFVLAI